MIIHSNRIDIKIHIPARKWPVILHGLAASLRPEDQLVPRLMLRYARCDADRSEYRESLKAILLNYFKLSLLKLLALRDIRSLNFR